MVIVRRSFIPEIEFNSRDRFEQVTKPDFSASLYSLVSSGVAGSQMSSRGYIFPEVPQDDLVAHEMPDYQRLKDVDMVDREEFVEDFIQNPSNYEKVERIEPKEETTSSDAVS